MIQRLGKSGSPGIGGGTINRTVPGQRKQKGGGARGTLNTGEDQHSLWRRGVVLLFFGCQREKSKSVLFGLATDPRRRGAFLDLESVGGGYNALPGYVQRVRKEE